MVNEPKIGNEISGGAWPYITQHHRCGADVTGHRQYIFFCGRYLIGIEVKNSILLPDYTDQPGKQAKSFDEAIQEAGETRSVPIILTTITAIGGLLPLVPKTIRLYSPLALVIIGGLISSPFTDKDS